ncbi:MAG TPA: hypothetical protein VM187_17300 [Niastella sp.]|nr:hypothetical protein [Niastella sp.]
MKNKISAVIGILVCFFLSKGCISDYMKGGDKTAISRYEAMLADNSKTTATLHDEYKEVTVKIMKVPVKTYEFKYDYIVDGHTFTGDHTFSTLPTSENLEVYYLKSNPSFSIVDPKSKLESEKEKNSAKGPLYWGIGWGILGLLVLLNFISELREKKAAVAVA